MGTPEFAIPAISALLNSEHQIIAVYSQPPSISGRGKKLQKSPIHIFAEKNNIEINTPKTFKITENVKYLRGLNPDLIVVAAYGLILRQDVLDIPKFGCFNIHPSMLPRWRGAAPIERTIEAGDTETSVCIMQMDAGLDTGDILLQEKVKIEPKETGSSLSKKTAQIGAKLLLEAIANIGKLQPTKQSDEGITYAHKISKEEGRINWELSAQEIERKIRAFDNFPKCWLTLNHENIKILSSEIIPVNSNHKAGTIIDDKFSVQTGNGQIRPLILQKPGKNPVSIKDFLNGTKIHPGTILDEI